VALPGGGGGGGVGGGGTSVGGLYHTLGWGAAESGGVFFQAAVRGKVWKIGKQKVGKIEYIHLVCFE